jgi:GNAT superfamily N-acetyltransferase
VAPALSEQEILDEVMVVARRSYPPLPDLRVIERPGWLQIITPSIKTGGLNEVLFSALDERSADEVIDAAIGEYRALGVKFRWSVGPGSAPADLGARLERRGMECSWGRGMARSTEAPAHDAPAPALAIEVAEVDAASVAVFSDVMARGWDADPATMLALNARVLAMPGYHQHMFLASCDGEPAATAAYVAFERSAHLLGGVVLPHQRGRGLYRALVLARLRHARARGIPLATSHAREATSAPILERMGFETVCRYPRYFG